MLPLRTVGDTQVEANLAAMPFHFGAEMKCHPGCTHRIVIDSVPTSIYSCKINERPRPMQFFHSCLMYRASQPKRLVTPTRIELVLTP